MTTCEDRMREEFEDFSFAQFIGAQYRSEVTLRRLSSFVVMTPSPSSSSSQHCRHLDTD